jgi:hypothetical protein
MFLVLASWKSIDSHLQLNIVISRKTDGKEISECP